MKNKITNSSVIYNETKRKRWKNSFNYRKVRIMSCHLLLKKYYPTLYFIIILYNIHELDTLMI